ncbi:MAG: hypothetical protein P8P36_09930 [Akkermansiaceae bacterium]|nr:hypothetical protein [Akkermansiaceae bacterium]
MPNLDIVTGIPAKALELLEAAGYLDVSDLREADAKKLSDELTKANNLLEVMASDPSQHSVEKWQELATEYVESAKGNASKNKRTAKARPESSDPGEDLSKKAKVLKPELVNFEQDEDMMEMLSMSPVAEPLDPLLMADQDVSMDNISDGILLNRCDGDMKINIMTTLGKADSIFRKDEVARAGLNSSRIRNFDDLESSVQYVRPLDRAPAKESLSLSDELNQGVDLRSRKFIKGVFHPHANTVRLAALSAVFFIAILVVNITSLVGLFLYRTGLGASTVVVWVVGLLLLLMSSAAAYVHFGTRARCVVCRQPPLMPKKCTKHKKAHYVKGIGYILPTALQLLVYKWFYCTYCGTAVRLNK